MTVRFSPFPILVKPDGKTDYVGQMRLVELLRNIEIAFKNVDELWQGKVHVAMGDGNPHLWLTEGLRSDTVISPIFTPTNIGTTVGRLVAFRFRVPITVANISYYGVSTVSDAYTTAIYKDSDGARLWILDPTNTTAAAWTASAA